MIINKLYIENFGLFYGKQELDFLPHGDKKITLIGGKNGNGKTTIFEAIRLCLYGPMVLEKRTVKNAYEKYLFEKIHHNSTLSVQPNSAAVGLEFQHAHLGEVDTYNVFRRWTAVNELVTEKFEVKKNGNDLAEIDSEQWQDFINDLIPPGLSQLFFFDGEKIQALAEDGVDNRQLSDSFKSLLGVDLVEKLKSDLEIYSIKQLKQSGATDLQDRIDMIQSEENKLEHELDAKNQEKAQLQSKIDKTYADIERQELLIKKEGGIFAEKRDDLISRKTRIETEINLIENQLREMCGDLLPFVFAQQLSGKLKKTLMKEDSLKNEVILQKNLEEKLSQLKSKLDKKEFWLKTEIDVKDSKAVSNKIISTINEIMMPKISNNVLVHNLSNNEQTVLLSLIDRAIEDTPIKLFELTKKHEVLTTNLHKITKEISFAPADSALSNFIGKSNELHQSLGTMQQNMQKLDEDIRQAQFNYEKTVRELRKLIDEMQNTDNLSNRIKMVTRVQNVLEEYHDKLEQEKIAEFNDVFLQCYDQIARKKGAFEQIKVDPKDYSVTLFKKGGKVILKSQLSAGEKQIYAIAVLWTLTKISHRPLPFIIDTPLGRLDIDHRDNLIRNFFPEASHQLIILSTDTEVDKKYMDMLKRKIVRTYNLKYDNNKTQVTNGYFWD
ncbi:DNA sulfur modification protein DndD [Candidatus Woesearchaeota archaeon]|nr:MAG: DNA sulfur modification protein DndD [Candidatus Woesearchaeota archaeon]